MRNKIFKFTIIFTIIILLILLFPRNCYVSEWSEWIDTGSNFTKSRNIIRKNNLLGSKCPNLTEIKDYENDYIECSQIFYSPYITLLVSTISSVLPNYEDSVDLGRINRTGLIRKIDVKTNYISYFGGDLYYGLGLENNEGSVKLIFESKAIYTSPNKLDIKHILDNYITTEKGDKLIFYIRTLSGTGLFSNPEVIIYTTDNKDCTPIDCVYYYGDWKACTPCGSAGGYQRREVIIKEPSQYGGQSCPEDDIKDCVIPCIPLLLYIGDYIFKVDPGIYDISEYIFTTEDLDLGSGNIKNKNAFEIYDLGYDIYIEVNSKCDLNVGFIKDGELYIIDNNNYIYQNKIRFSDIIQDFLVNNYDTLELDYRC